MRVAAPAILCVAALLGATACSGTGTGDDSSSSGDVVKLEFWSWPVGTDKVVEEFNATHKNIQVHHTDAGGGDDSSAKLLTAVRSGGAPDVTTIEYTTLPAMVVAGAVKDITEDVGDIKGDFTDGTWDQTTFDGVVYGVPEDVGPAAMVYNAAAFEKYGAQVPTTWEEYKTAAQQIKTANPEATIGSFPSTELGFWAAAAAQAGSEWWKYEDGAWQVNIGDENSQKVADFFQGMYDEGLISNQSLLTADYNSKLNADQMLSWPSALWATGVVQGVADDTQMGNWRMARFPAWTAGDEAVPYMGGSALAVTSTSKHPKEAMEFISWLAASKEGADQLMNVNGSYPASTIGQDLSTSQTPPDLVKGQDDYYTLAADIASNTVPVSWGPDVNYAKTVLDEKLSAAMQNGTSWADAFVATGEAVKKDLEDQGYKVSN